MDGSLMDLGEFRTHLLAALVRIAEALEQANKADVVAVLSEVLKERVAEESEVGRGGDALPDAEAWRMR